MDSTSDRRQIAGSGNGRSLWRSVTVVLVVAALVAVSPGQVAASQHIEFTASGGSAPPGETVTVTFTATNNGQVDNGTAIRITDLPDDLTITNHTDDGGVYNADERTWINLNVSAGESTSPSVTVRLPTNASGEYEIDAEAETTDGTVENATATVSVEESDAAVDLTATGGSARPGETVTVGFAITNEGSEPDGTTTRITDFPDALEVVSRDDAGGFYNPDEMTWLHTTIEPDNSTTPSLTVRLPDDASGEYEIGAEVQSANGATATATTTVTVEDPPENNDSEEEEDPGPIVRVGEATVTTGSSTTVPVTLSKAPNGVAGVEITVELANPEAATITDGSLNGKFAFADSSVNRDGTAVQLNATDTKLNIQSTSSSVRIGSVTLEGENVGSSDLTVSAIQVTNDNSNAMNPGTRAGELTVNSAGESTPTPTPDSGDGDGDGGAGGGGSGGAGGGGSGGAEETPMPEPTPTPTPDSGDGDGDGGAGSGGGGSGGGGSGGADETPTPDSSDGDGDGGAGGGGSGGAEETPTPDSSDDEENNDSTPTPEPTSTPTPEPTPTPTPTPGEQGPGFGIVTAILALLGSRWLVRR